jgi:hypothetical protein
MAFLARFLEGSSIGEDEPAIQVWENSGNSRLNSKTPEVARNLDVTFSEAMADVRPYLPLNHVAVGLTNTLLRAGECPQG